MPIYFTFLFFPRLLPLSFHPFRQYLTHLSGFNCGYDKLCLIPLHSYLPASLPPISHSAFLRLLLMQGLLQFFLVHHKFFFEKRLTFILPDHSVSSGLPTRISVVILCFSVFKGFHTLLDPVMEHLPES